MMVSANLPLHKVNNQQFRNFLENYTNQYIPLGSTLQKTIYLPIVKMFKKNWMQQPATRSGYPLMKQRMLAAGM
jgi:hypothetical protein